MQDEMSGMDNAGAENAGSSKNAANLLSQIQREDTKGDNSCACDAAD